MINKSFQDIDFSDFEDLLNNSIPESVTLEYKALLDLSSLEARKEFLYDFSAFANSIGGDLIIGITEDRNTGLPISITGISASNFDQLKSQITSIIRDGISPRITHFEIKEFTYFDKTVLLIRVFQSWSAPHMITLGGSCKFYRRNSQGKERLDVDQLRETFNMNETIDKKIRSFVKERLTAIQTTDIPAGFVQQPAIVLHVIPLSAFRTSNLIDLSRIRSHEIMIQAIGGGNRDWKYNIDGLLSTYSNPNGMTNQENDHNAIGKLELYIQVYRSGIIETTNSRIFGLGKHKVIPGDPRRENFEKYVVKAVSSYLNAYEKLQVSPPFFVFLTFLGVRGFRLISGEPITYDEQKIDRDILAIPETVIESYGLDISASLRKCFDIVWNAGGYEKSPNYSDD